MPKFDLDERFDETEGCTMCGCGEFITEFAEDFYSDEHRTQGVSISSEGQNIRLVYNGLLASSGANDVYAVVSYGNNQHWDDIRYYQMDNIGERTFRALIPNNENMNINVVFKDSANNWDNNKGRNYSFNSH
ncbi:UNVERIFIED_CONTAM: putative carbohydrate-binding protein with starch-binding CBM53 [Acetivibrio alkalicellulosi]